MRKKTYLSIIICFLSLTLITSCNESQLEPQEFVKSPQIMVKEISIKDMETVMSKHNLEIPFYDLESGNVYYAVVIQIDIATLSGNVNYDEVKVVFDIETDATTIDEENGSIRILAAIPEKVDRKAEIEVISKVAGNFDAAIGEITGKIGVGKIGGGIGTETTTTENYEGLYRTVIFNQPSTTSVYWTFKPFKDKAVPIVPGKDYLIALIEVSDQNHEYSVKAQTDCKYNAPRFNLSILSGLFPQKSECIPDERKQVLTHIASQVPTEPPVPGILINNIVDVGIAGTGDRVNAWYRDGTVSVGMSEDLDMHQPPAPYTLPPGKSVDDIVGIAIACSSDYAFAWYKDGTVSAGRSSWNLGDYRQPRPYSLP